MNRLASEASPYLRQHAANPVDWYPWGEEARARARTDDRPLLVSIGYSSCHWCHVMAHESFEDPSTAAVMNRLFVNVKVDREERPDVDAVYMEAVQALTGQGGWPLTVFCDPDGRPFYGGTYFPPAATGGRPGFVEVLQAVADAWRHRRGDLEASTARLMEVLERDPLRPAAAAGDASAPGTDPTAALLDRAVADAARRFDPRGGFSDAPKFPAPMLCDLLLHHHVHHPSEATLAMVTTTLDAMAAGGIHDQLGGGFHRYSVDAHWIVPHFEKMLSDQALLAATYLHAHLVTGEERHRRVVETTLDYVLGDLRHPAGGFLTARDADSEGAEGRYYLWDLDEIEDVAGADAAETVAYYGATTNGNFVDPHHGLRGNVLRVVDRDTPPSAAVERARAALLARRATRIAPGRDDKVLTGWNALTLRTLAEAGSALGRDDWTDAARRAARFLLANLRRDDGRWLRSWHPSAGARHLAVSADYGALLEAFVTLAETDDVAWLEEADRVARELIRLFHDPDGGGFWTAGRDAERLVADAKDVQDGATPSGTSLAASGLLRLAALTGEHDVAAPAVDALRRLTPLVDRHPGAFPYALGALEWVVYEPVEVALIGPPGPGLDALRAEVAGRLLPATVWCRGPGNPAIPLLEGRGPVGGAPAAYVCERFSCRVPTTDPADLRRQLDAAVSARRRPPAG